MKIVKVRWLDASHVEDEQTEYQLLSRKEIIFTTIGMLIADEPGC